MPALLISAYFKKSGNFSIRADRDQFENSDLHKSAAI